MKVGVRKPSLKKSISARTTGRAKRAVKSSVNPLYGKKGMGWINDPKKATYNKVYNKTTISIGSISILLITIFIVLLVIIFKILFRGIYTYEDI